MHISVCLFVCCIAPELHVHTSNFLCMLPTAVAQSFSSGIVINYVLLVLWMTLYFPTVGPVAPQLPYCNTVYGLTPRLCDIGCILSWMTAGTKTRRVVHARATRSGVCYLPFTLFKSILYNCLNLSISQNCFKRVDTKNVL